GFLQIRAYAKNVKNNECFKNFNPLSLHSWVLHSPPKRSIFWIDRKTNGSFILFFFVDLTFIDYKNKEPEMIFR
ncbi:MAG: hypothetical protein O4751_02245, partial [Trichodesmium sp. St2_bin6]|nr:hypothetical protein [Trichodesmium sp. St2_bin6]